jgi:hypothetical protein
MIVSKKIAFALAWSVAFVFSSSVTQAQFGGVQVQVGGYGSGVRVGSYGYGNGYYGGYRGGFVNPYYGNQYSRNYGGFNTYGNGGYYGNGFRYNNYPSLNYGYRASRAYIAPLRSVTARRFRYR